jgi:lysozyme
VNAARGIFVFIGLAALGAAAWASFGISQTGGIPVDNPDGIAADLLGSLDGLGGSVIGSTSQGLQFSDAGLSALMGEEGFSATPYPDFKGNSIGYGHLIKAGESFTSISEAQGRELLAQDVAWAVDAVNSAVSVELDQNQFDALVSFVYNVGKGAFLGSTLLRKLNAGDYDGAAAEFPRWNRAGGQVNDSLVARRAREQQRFEA